MPHPWIYRDGLGEEAPEMSPQNTSDDLDQAIEQHHLSVDQFAKGTSKPLEALYSRRDDATLGNPFGPFVRGFDQVARTMEHAAEHYREGEATGFDEIATYVTPDLACTVEVERLMAKIGGADETSPISLRVTTLFRREDGVWKIVHRHADPITTAQPAESVIQK
jgi:ketosteroid isomerase-like protein